MNPLLRIAVAGLTAGLFAMPSCAEHRKVVDGVAINIGVVPATQLLRADPYERAIHRTAAADATHHVVVAVANAQTGDAIGDARVTLELVDPRGGTQRKPLVRGEPGGAPDYSEMFRFGWAGEYRLRVTVERAGASPVKTVFGWTQAGY